MPKSPSSDGTGKTGSEALGELIRARRDELGWSRQQLADASGVPYPTIAQIETGYRGVSPSRLGVIARALGLDPKELYDVLANDSPAGSAPSASAPARHSRASSRARRYDDAGWHVNPAYAAAEAPPSAPLDAAMPEADVVDRVVHLLSELPPHERLDALGRVQSRLLAQLIQEEVQRVSRSVG